MNNIQLKAAIVDDEEDSLQVTSYLLQKYCPQVSIQFLSADAEEALEKLRTTQIDVLFIDVEMPRMSGFQLLTQLGSFQFKVIFTTAYQQYMLPAIKIKAFDYLVKPIDRSELVQTVERIQQDNNAVQQEVGYADNIKLVHSKIIVPTGTEFEFLPVDTIVRCQSENNYCIIFLDNGRKITLSKTLKTIEDQLPKNVFIRVHNSHLVNMTFIVKYKKVDGGFFEMSDGEHIPISRTKKEEILHLLGLK